MGLVYLSRGELRNFDTANLHRNTKF